MEITAATRMIRARDTMLERSPFYGVLSMYLKVIEDPKCETMMVNGIELRYSPAFVDGLSNHELVGVYAHEISHCAFKHMTRRGDRDHARWNSAADYEINSILIADGFVLPAGAFIDPKFDRMSAEDIYAALEAEEQASKGAKGDQPAAGKGTGPASDPGACGGVEDAGPQSSPAAIEQASDEWDAHVRQALSVVKARNAGKLPGGLQGVAENLRAPAEDWRAILRQFATDLIRVDHTWSRPNRRLISQGIYMPGTRADGIGQIVVIVDTSGSIDKRTLGAFSNEVRAFLDEDICAKLTIVYADAKVQGVEEFEPGDAFPGLKATGGGGTNFRPAFDWVAANAPDAVAVIYFTDLLTSDFGDEPPCAVLWAAWGAAAKVAGGVRDRVPFGDVIHIVG